MVVGENGVPETPEWKNPERPKPVSVEDLTIGPNIILGGDAD